jgi:hypothetical protein
MPSCAETKNPLRFLTAAFGLCRGNRRRAPLRVCVRRWPAVCRRYWLDLKQAYPTPLICDRREATTPRLCLRQRVLHASTSVEAHKTGGSHGASDLACQEMSRLPRCPLVPCRGRMRGTALHPSLEGTGLQAVQCLDCGHHGFISTDRIILLFGGGHEQVCMYGPSTLTLTIRFSGSALRRLRARGLTPARSAACATRWALLRGQVTGTVWVSDQPLSRLEELLSHDPPTTPTEEAIRCDAPAGFTEAPMSSTSSSS